MVRQSLLGPISILAIGVVLIAMLLAGPGSQTVALQKTQTAYPTSTTPSAAYLSPTAATTRTTATTTSPTRSPTASTSVSPTDSPTRTPTDEPTTPALITPNIPFESPTISPFEEDDPTEEETSVPTVTDIPTSTTTPTPSNLLVCEQGVTVEVTGYGPPRVALLLYFDQRPVGGGSVTADGRFSIPLKVGKEQPGQYSVVVRIRGSRQILRQLTCTVPEFTPTPTPFGR